MRKTLAPLIIVISITAIALTLMTSPAKMYAADANEALALATPTPAAFMLKSTQDSNIEGGTSLAFSDALIVTAMGTKEADVLVAKAMADKPTLTYKDANLAKLSAVAPGYTLAADFDGVNGLTMTLAGGAVPSAGNCNFRAGIPVGSAHVLIV
ncbi:MAG: hypothetical protein WC768_02900 [Patescibacteria group bacterium]|jgi:hypothetical protein